MYCNSPCLCAPCWAMFLMFMCLNHLTPQTKYTESVSNQRQNISVENVVLQLRENCSRDGDNQKAPQVHGLCITTWLACWFYRYEIYTVLVSDLIHFFPLWQNMNLCMLIFFPIKVTLKCFKLHKNKYLHVHIYIVPNSTVLSFHFTTQTPWKDN